MKYFAKVSVPLVRTLERRAWVVNVGGFLAVTFSLHVETPVRDSLVRGVRSEKVQFRKNLAGSEAAGEGSRVSSWENKSL